MPGKHDDPKPMDWRAKGRVGAVNPRCDGDDRVYDAETVEFMMAMEAHQRRTGRRWPPWSEVLDVLRSLGWRKMEATSGD